MYQKSIFACRQKLLKWNGWGYNDSKFIVIYDESAVYFEGNRYFTQSITIKQELLLFIISSSDILSEI